MSAGSTMTPSQQLPQELEGRSEEDGLQQEDQIRITFYTDPLCCWSWAFEKHWRRLVANHGDQISYELVMGGMIPSWSKYNDPLNSISTPAQMGPLWMYASQVTQSKMRHSIWIEDPPDSSYPPSIAVKTVGLQSATAAEQYLFDIRVAMMEQGLNISKEKVLLEVARNLQADDFDFELFFRDWKAGKGKDAFREDLRQTRFYDVGRFPTLTLWNSQGTGVMIVGYRPYEQLKEAFDYVRAAGGHVE